MLNSIRSLSLHLLRIQDMIIFFFKQLIIHYFNQKTRGSGKSLLFTKADYVQPTKDLEEILQISLIAIPDMQNTSLTSQNINRSRICLVREKRILYSTRCHLQAMEY
ncbi:uncharacterized protein G2W53_030798 [Senna tora]|uniref:Uncharacterized protein n=1 Tax=Senna tora TaxID=362788 RepID=A0A834WH40_9FABA|nr:uncharacterized protein G2W53_030798 [Senna tora]